MFKRVDEVKKLSGEKLSGFSYTNIDGHEETVAFSRDGLCVFVKDTINNQTCIYNEDIPKLIKALQASYNYIQENEFD